MSEDELEAMLHLAPVSPSGASHAICGSLLRCGRLLRGDVHDPCAGAHDPCAGAVPGLQAVGQEGRDLTLLQPDFYGFVDGTDSTANSSDQPRLE